jgi:hypothetical protein
MQTDRRVEDRRIRRRRWEVDDLADSRDFAGNQVDGRCMTFGLFAPSSDDCTSANFEQTREADRGRSDVVRKPWDDQSW